MAPEDVLTKIQKLLDLQEGAKAIGSLEEAANAAEKVQRLLTKHNLEMADVSLHTQKDSTTIDRYEFEDSATKKNEGKWILQLYNVICRNNYCRLVVTKKFSIDLDKVIEIPVVVGTKLNVEVVRKLALRLEERIRTFESQAWQRDKYFNKNRNAYRRAYFLGAIMGIDKQLKIAREREMQENNNVRALVVQNDEELQRAMNMLFGNLGRPQKRRELSNHQAIRKGYSDGLNMSTGESIGS